jgi:glycosyltransferase involved in cell wall biosynthesis
MDRTPNVWIVSDRPDLPESHIYAELPRLGVRLTFFHAPDANPAALARIRDGGAECREILFRNRLDFAASAALRRELRQRPCDVIYATVNKPLAAVLRATIGFPRVKVVGYRGTIGHLSRWDPASWLTYFHPGLDHVVTVSDAVRRYFTDSLGFPESKVTRIYKGHDVEWYRARKTDFEMPEALRGLTVVSFAGQIRHVKGVNYLLDAMALVPPDVKVGLLLLGRVQDADIGRRIDVAVKADPRIFYAGFRTDVTAIVGMTDIAVMPTVEREGLAKAVIEAQALGVPAIVTDVGGLPEIVRDGETGLVVPPRDARALADAIQSLALDPARRRVMGEAAVRRVGEVFDYRESARQFAALFGRLCSPEERN